MPNVADLFDTQGFPARWQCGTAWADEPWLGYMHILSDLLTWGAYTAIPLVLAYFVWRRRDVPMTGIFWLFCAFIFACGTVHLIEAILFWWPVYRLSALAKLATAGVSWATVAALIPATPKALRLPGLAKINAELTREMRQRHSAERELEHANRDLARKNQDINEYVSIITHDLKHPAFSIQTLQGLLKRKLADRLDDEAVRYIDLSIGECERMMDMLARLGGLARIERMPLQRESVNLLAFCLACRDRFQGAAHHAGCRIEVHAPDESVTVPRQPLDEAMSNLIDNALKYGHPSQDYKIVISAEITPSHLTLSVRDHGPGIPAKHHERVFQLFHRLNPDGAPGTGVGLASVRRLMQHAGGEVLLESSPGSGACFILKVPLET